jgi:O-antigen/teichoic acid export membrane protein
MPEDETSQAIDSNFIKSAMKNSFWNFITSIIGRLGGLVFTILIARMLQPELFGLYSLATSIMFIILTFVDAGINTTLLRYVAAALGKKDDKKAASYFRYFLKLKTALTFILALVLIILAKPISIYLFGKPELFMPLVLCSIFMIFLSLTGFYESVLYAAKKAKYVTMKEILYQILRVVLPVLSVYLISDKLFGTLVGLIISSAAAFILLVMLTYKNYKFLFKKIDINKEEKKRILNFLFFMTIAGITSTFFVSVDTVILGAFVKSEFIGYYRAAFSLVGAVIGLITLTNILIPIFTQLEGQQLERIFNKVFRYSAILSFPIAFGMALIAMPFINIIYGPSYLQSTIPLYLLSLLVIEGATGGLFTWLFTAKEKPKTLTKILLMSTVLNIILNYAFIMFFLRFGEIYAVLGASLAVVISRYFNLFYIAKMAKKQLNISVKASSITKPLIASITMLVLLIIFKGTTKLAWPKSIIEIVFAAAVYFIVLMAIKGITKEDFELPKRLLKK